MTNFHDNIRMLIEDVEMFLVITLKDEELKSTSESHRQRLIDRLETVRRDYPALQIKESLRVKENLHIGKTQCTPPPRPSKGPTLPPPPLPSTPLPTVLPTPTAATTNQPHKTPPNRPPPPVPLSPENKSQRTDSPTDSGVEYSCPEEDEVGRLSAPQEDEEIEEETESVYECVDNVQMPVAASSSCGSSADSESMSSQTSSEVTSVVFTSCQELMPTAKRHGFLDRKKDSFLKISRTRKYYAVLHLSTLFLFDKATDLKQRLAINITEQVEARECEYFPRKDNVFEITCPASKTFYFATGNRRDLEDWIFDINMAIKALKSSADFPVKTIPTTVPQLTDFRSLTESAEEKSTMYDETDEHENRDMLAEDERNKTCKEEEEERDDYENWYMGKWDCQADSQEELSFKRGQLIRIISKDFDKWNWWIGENEDGLVGLVPKVYLMEAYELIC